MAQRSVEGLRSKTLQLLEYGYWDYFSELHDEPAGRTVTVTTDLRGLVTPHLVNLLEYGYWDYFSKLHDEPAGWTVIVTTDHRGLRNPTLS